MFRIGDQIGPYSLLQKIGRGAFGEVWLAEEKTHISTHRVALKLPNEEDVDLEAIRQEANVWEEVKGHPNILPIIKADVVEDQIYIASEYAPDGSLSKWLKMKGGKAPTVEIAVRMTHGILSGLAHLHSKGIVHRDLKPENILLQAETPRIADFGIARLIKATSNSTKATGTPSYMAPECFYGTRSEQTDLWAVGVIFHLLLTGKQAFPQPDQVSVMNAILNGSPEIDASIPLYFQHIIITALTRTLGERYVSAFEMLRDLEGLRSTPHVTERRFSGITIPTNAGTEVEVETRVIPKHVERQTVATVLKNLNFWQTAFIALAGISLLAVVLIYATSVRKTDPTTQLQADDASLQVQPIGPATGAQEENLVKLPAMTNAEIRAAANSNLARPMDTPGGGGYNAWANGVAPPPSVALPANAALKNYVPPRGQVYTIDPNGGSQFMPQDRGVILVPVPANTYTALKPTPKPMATPPPKKTISDDCRYNGKCN